MKLHILAAPAIGAVLATALSIGGAMAAPALTINAGKLLSGPGTDYASLTSLPGGSHVIIMWCGTHDNWCLVNDHNKLGWVPFANLETRVGNGAPTISGPGGNGHAGAAPVVGKPVGNIAIETTDQAHGGGNDALTTIGDRPTLGPPRTVGSLSGLIKH